MFIKLRELSQSPFRSNWRADFIWGCALIAYAAVFLVQNKFEIHVQSRSSRAC